MRLLGIDLGDKRTGLAICNSEETIVSPLEVIEAGKTLCDKIIEITGQYQAEAIVFGLPLNMDGSEGDRAKSVRNFAAKLAEKTDTPIHFHDERLSSYSAAGKLAQTGLTHKKKKNRLDAIAAMEILKEYIAMK